MYYVPKGFLRKAASSLLAIWNLDARLRARFSVTSELAQLKDVLARLGYEPDKDRGNGHRVYKRDGYQPYVLASTPSDYRSLENCLSDLARCAGFDSKAALERHLGLRAGKSPHPRHRKRAPARIERDFTQAAEPEEIWGERDKQTEPHLPDPRLLELRIANLKSELKEARRGWYADKKSERIAAQMKCLDIETDLSTASSDLERVMLWKEVR